jgi:hypothetical protein
VEKLLAAHFTLAFRHFLVLIQESNQRKSRKNNASTLQANAHPAIFSGLPTSFFVYDDIRRFSLQCSKLQLVIFCFGFQQPGERQLNTIYVALVFPTWHITMHLTRNLKMMPA